MADSKLTIMKIRGLAKPGRYSDGAGLYLDVKGDSRTWLFRFKLAGKESWHGLGSLSDVSLLEAREKARECRRLLREGKNPIEARRGAIAKAQEQQSHTFRALAEKYIAAQKPGWKNAKHGDQWLNTLAAYAFPAIGHKPVSDVTVNDVLNILEPIWTTKPETAGRVRGRIENVLAYAATRRLRPAENPAQWRGHLEHLLPARARVTKIEHHAAIPYAALPALMQRLSQSKGFAALCLRFLVLTASRSGEARGAVWSEIDLDAAIWTIPEARMKAGYTHRVPLSEPALTVLQAIADLTGGTMRPDRWVFPGMNPAKPLSDVSVSKALRIAGGGDYTVHGMRSAFRDWCAEQTAYPGEIAEAALAHSNRNKVEAAYLRSDHFEKRRRLMKEWGSYSISIAPKEQSKNILLIRKPI